MKPNQPSKRDDIKESISEKKGIISAMMNANTQVRAMMADQVAQPVRVLEYRWWESAKILKKMKRADTDYGSTISSLVSCMRTRISGRAHTV